jgi:hypothetical protein
MKISRNVFLMTAALLIGFSSCSKDDGPNNVDDGPKSMTFSISGVSTKQVGPAVVHDSDVEFVEGILYLTDVSGIIIRHFTITDAPSTFGTTGGAPAVSGQNIYITELKDGSTIILEQIPANVTTATLVGNNNAVLPTTGNISAVNQTLISVNDQLIKEGVSSINLYASKAITKTGVTPPINTDGHVLWQVDLVLRPTMARVELTDMYIGGLKPDGFQSRLVSYTVTGIFVDNYVNRAQVSGFTGVAATANANWTNNSALNNVANWNITGSDWYTAANHEVVWDNVSKPIVVEDEVTLPTDPVIITASATAGDVWGYNVFADAPSIRMIVRLDNVWLNVDRVSEVTGLPIGDEDINIGTQFVVITGFKHPGAAGANIPTFTAGDVYKTNAGSFWFDERNFVIDPNIQEIDLKVTVTVAKWKVVATEPIF